MQKLWNKVKNAKAVQIYVGSFLLATIMMVLVLMGNDIYPGSKRTLLTSDMRAQYVSFLASLRYLGKGDNSIFFNWSRSLGGNYLGLFAYYLASPLSWLTLLFDIPHMPEAIYFLTVLKIGLCGLSFSVYVNNSVASKKNHPAIVIFSCCYALMSYNIVYAMCIMWLDAIILLPLVLLGIEEIIKGKRGGIFLTSITACFLFNYYISYMVGVFCFLYLIYRLVCLNMLKKGKNVLGIFGRFGINTILGIGMSAFLLLPTLLDLSGGRMADDIEKRDFIFNFPLWRILRKLQPSQFDSIMNVGLPNIYCGMVITVLAVLFFIQKHHPIREKISSGVLIVLLILSFWIRPLDLVWHVFQTPNGLPYRYAFLFSFMLILLAYQAFEEIDITKIKVGSLLYRMICVFTVIDLFFNGSNLIGAIDLNCYYSLRYDYDDIILPAMELTEQAQQRDDGLYRMDKDFAMGLNDSMLLGYNSLTHSSSAYNYMACEFIEHMGMARIGWWNMNYGSTLLTDSLFGVKYRIAEHSLSNEWIPLAKENCHIQWYTLYENPYALPIAYLVNEEGMEESVEWSDNPFVNQMLWFSQVTGEDVMCYEPIDYVRTEEKESITLSFTAPSDKPIYIRILGKKKKQSVKEEREWNDYLESLSLSERFEIEKKRVSNLTVNDTDYGNYYDNEKNCNLCIGTFAPGEEVTIVLDSKGLYDIGEAYIVQYDDSELLAILEEFSSRGLNIIEHKNGGFTGEIDAGEHQVLFTTIPYDKGFTVKVDGVKTEYTSYFDTFMAIPIEQGSHTISVSYISPGFTIGCIVSSIGLMAMVLYYFPLKKYGKEKNHVFERRKEKSQ